MKFSTRLDADVPAQVFYDHVCDFGRAQRLLSRSNVVMRRLSPAEASGVGICWYIDFRWQRRDRRLRLDVTDYDRPERLSLRGGSDQFQIAIDMVVVALARNRSRLLFDFNVKPLNMRARLLIQTARLGRARLQRRFDRVVKEFFDLKREPLLAATIYGLAPVAQMPRRPAALSERSATR